MMRRYHRWLSVIFGIFLLWISVTGVLSQAGRLYVSGEPERAAAAAPAGEGAEEQAEEAARPPQTPARPPQTPARQFVHFVTELHSGEEFGITGQLISLLSGLALVFFAASGLWMYIELYRGRMVKVRAGKRVSGGKWFWR